jgi:glycosyltransferase involved in cell wall biosynthesis
VTRPEIAPVPSHDPRPETAAAGPVPAVLFVVFQTENRANGGVESITQVIENLRGVAPVVLTQAETPAAGRWRRAGATVHVRPFGEGRGRAARARGLLASNLAVRRMVRASGARVVHCNDIRSLQHAGPGARAAGAAVVFNIRDVKPPGERYGSVWRLAQLADRVLVLSREMRSALRARLPGALPGTRPATPVEFIYSIVDPDVMHPLPARERAALRLRLGMAEDEVAVGYVATVNEKKGQLELLERAGAALRDGLPRARLHLVGDFRPDRDDYARRCQEAVGRLGLEGRVAFHGYRPGVAEWYQACDIVLLASRREGLARCMIESLACGTPVVSFDVCSAREILEEHDCGRVAAQGDYDGLAVALGELAADPALRARLGENGVRAARRLFDPAPVAAAYVHLYRALSGGADR